MTKLVEQLNRAKVVQITKASGCVEPVQRFLDGARCIFAGGKNTRTFFHTEQTDLWRNQPQLEQ